MLIAMNIGSLKLVDLGGSSRFLLSQGRHKQRGASRPPVADPRRGNVDSPVMVPEPAHPGRLPPGKRGN
jgi:hypothetical protein